MSSCDRCNQVDKGADGEVDDRWEEEKRQANQDRSEQFCWYVC